MLSISAPSKFALTLHSVPPFFLESCLALILVILLAVPLIARVQMLLENPMNYFTPLPRKHPPPRNHPTYHQPPPPTPVISVNLQLDTIRPITSSSSIHQEPINIDMQLIHPNISPFNAEKPLQLHNSHQPTPPAHDYEYYRHNYIELNLKKQFGDRIPGNVIFNAHHLTTIDSKILLKLNRKFHDDLFDFIDQPEATNKTRENSKSPPNPTAHFHPKSSSKPPISIDKSIGTIDAILEIDHVPELIDFKDRTPTPTSSRSPRRRRHLAESADNVQKLNPKSWKKLDSTASLMTPSPAPDKQSDAPKALRKTPKQLESPKRLNSKNPVARTFKTECLDVKSQKDSGADRNDRSSITCPSVVSSDAFSMTSSSSKQPERIVSRPTSSCGSSKGFRNFRSRVNSRPRSGGYFGWDIPDHPDAVDVPVVRVIPPVSAVDDAVCHEDDGPKNMDKNDKFMCEASPVLQSPQNSRNNVTDDRDQCSHAVNARNGEERMHKSRLPVRQTEGWKKGVKKNSSIDKSRRELRKKEDVALQVSASVIKSGIDDNFRNSFPSDAARVGGDMVECNQESLGDGTMGRGISKERNTSNQEVQVKSLVGGG